MFSKWSDKTNKTYSEIIDNILNYNSWKIEEIDQFDGAPLSYEVQRTFPNDLTINVNSTKITFNSLYFSFEEVRSIEFDNPLRSSRVVTYSGNIIIYTDGKTVQYIIDRAATTTSKKIIRKINNYTRREQQIEDAGITFQKDMFLWLFYRVIGNGSSTIDINNKEAYINRITGFKGATTRDEMNAVVSGTGSDLMNLISSLVFLLEKDSFSQIEISLEFENDTYVIVLALKNLVNIVFEKCFGKFKGFEEDKLENNAKITLITLLELVPSIVSSYNTDISNAHGTEEINKEFYNSVGNEVKKKLDLKVKNE